MAHDEVGRRFLGVVIVGGHEEHRRHPGALRARDVGALDVADVGRLTGTGAELLERAREDARLGLAHPVFVGEVEVAEVLEHAVAFEQLAQHESGRVAGVADDREAIALRQRRQRVHGAGQRLGRKLEDELLELRHDTLLRVVRQAHAQGGEDAVHGLGAERRAVLVDPETVEEVVAALQRVVDGRGRGLRRDAADLFPQDRSAAVLALPAARVHEERVPVVEGDCFQHGLSVADGGGRTGTAWAAKTAGHGLRGRWRPRSERQEASLSGTRQRSPDWTGSRARKTAGWGRSTTMMVRSMLPQLGHINMRESTTSPSGARNRCPHSPHEYSLPDIGLLSGALSIVYPETCQVLQVNTGIASWIGCASSIFTRGYCGLSPKGMRYAVDVFRSWGTGRGSCSSATTVANG